LKIAKKKSDLDFGDDKVAPKPKVERMGLEDISWHPYIPKPKRKRMNEARESGPKIFTATEL
jgi:hypothetical protein